MTPSAIRHRRLSAGMIAIVLAILCGCASTRSGGPGSSRRGLGSLLRRQGAPWTIQCLELPGPQGTQQIEQIAETLRRTEGIRTEEVFTMDHADGYARLYYGTYYRRTDPKSRKRSTPKRMVEDLNYIKQLGTGPGQYYFVGAIVVRMPTPDVGNPEWALSTVNGVYTLQVAAFEPTDDFHEYKQAAANHCAFLRDEGYEAYYYHGSASSMVTVPRWRGS